VARNDKRNPTERARAARDTASRLKQRAEDVVSAARKTVAAAMDGMIAREFHGDLKMAARPKD
jgi:hypothetical protein